MTRFLGSPCVEAPPPGSSFADPPARTAVDANVYIGKNAIPVLTTHGGFIGLLVKLNAKVTSGQKVAIQRNAFGEVVAEYASPGNGLVGGLRSDATSEPGDVLLFIVEACPEDAIRMDTGEHPPPTYTREGQIYDEKRLLRGAPVSYEKDPWLVRPSRLTDAAQKANRAAARPFGTEGTDEYTQTPGFSVRELTAEARARGEGGK